MRGQRHAPRPGSARFAKSAPVRRRSSLRVRFPRERLAAALVALAAIFVGIWYFGPTWRIGSIEVVNNTGIPGEQIIGASGLQGQHYQFADLDAAARRVDELPGVDAADVTCRWFGSVKCIIAVLPARPLAVWKSPAGSIWSDYEGKVQRTGGPIDASLHIAVESGEPPALGADLDAMLLRALVEVAQIQPPLVRLTWSEEYGLMYDAADGTRIRLGVAESDGAIQSKLTLARALDASLKARGVRPRVIDVRMPEAPYYSQ